MQKERCVFEQEQVVLFEANKYTKRHWIEWQNNVCEFTGDGF
jgi:hypothetical protein